MRIAVIFLSICVLNTSCNGQKKKECSDNDIILKIKKLPEVVNDSVQLAKDNKVITFQISRDTIENKIYRVFKEAADDEFHISTLHLYYINDNCEIFSYNTVNDSLSPTNKKQKKMDTTIKTEVKFTDLFNDGTNINFSPADLDQNKPEIQSFKKKLEHFETENPIPEDFDIQNLSLLINNETFFDSQHYTNSSWIQYFIKKNRIDTSNLHELMIEAISKEDYNAVKILLNNHYIVSKKDLQTAIETKENVQQKTAENKTDGYESYLVANSKIMEIAKILDVTYKNNHIQDPDGYTNLRKEKSATSEILQKIKSGEKIEVLDNFGNWFLVKTEEGKQGYVHKSRVKSE